MLTYFYISVLSLLTLYQFRFLREVSSNAAANSMDSQNLAIVFTPTIFQPDMVDPMKAVMELKFSKVSKHLYIATTTLTTTSADVSAIFITAIFAYINAYTILITLFLHLSFILLDNSKRTHRPSQYTATSNAYIY